MRYQRRSVHVVGAILEEAVEMYAGRLVSECIVHICNHAIPLGEIEEGKRPLAIDTRDEPFILTVRVGKRPSDVPIVGQSRSADHSQIAGDRGEIEQHIQVRRLCKGEFPMRQEAWNSELTWTIR